MRLLMVSMFSNHFFNWTEQLRNSNHEIHWIDVFDSDTYVPKIDFVNQVTGWRFKWKYPGRYWVKNKIPQISKAINYINQRDLAKKIDQKIKEINPDVVQSFVLFSAAYPIREVMAKYPDIKWIYSAWGNDLYFMQQFQDELVKIKQCLPCFDYMFADCNRDAVLAKNLGFNGNYLGTFPGGGGYDLSKWQKYQKPFSKREVILIKGYEGMLGRARFVVRAIKKMRPGLEPYQIVFFGCSTELKKSIKEEGLDDWSNVKVLMNLPHDQVMQLMGKSRIYIGNCISDGTPNTLLEAIVMGVFPIQSNPGNATAEIITNGINGLLIQNPEDELEISMRIREAIKYPEMLEKAILYNDTYVRPGLERGKIIGKVIEKYSIMESQLKESIC